MDDWTRLQDLFHAASARAVDEREAFLDAECGGDAELRRRVEVLLAAHETSAGFMESPPPEVADLLDADRPAAKGRHLGRYEIVRVIASGGMGTVYEAVQENPRRTVALKVMRRSLASDSARRRFRHESQILGRLAHPGIARIYEAGIHAEDGEHIPFFAMEHVPVARTLLAHARDTDLPVRDRLELFAKVCDAVHHGHQRGVIHRDLKPDNILVDGTGSPKIIDFGVARVTDPDEAVTSLRTGLGELVGTLRYMSPEQCAGDPTGIDVRSDVYALGVVLYELLTDRLPYDLDDLPLVEITRVVRDEPPRRLSSVDRTLRGDLETIVGHTLEKEKEQRYASAAELATDVRRYLRDEPILARPPSAIYQARKFAKRHKGLVAAVAAVLLVSVTGFAVSSALYLRSEVARKATQRHAEAADRARLEAEFREYTANIAAAENALRAYDIADARRRIDAAPESLRGWEWHHFSNRLDRSARALPSAGRGIRCVAVSPDGRLIAGGTRRGTVELWDAASGSLLDTLELHRDVVDGIAFSHDGTRLASGSLDIIVWDVDARTEALRFAAHDEHIHSLAFGPDDRTLLSASKDGSIRLWDVATGARLDQGSMGHAGRVHEAVFSPDGSIVASASIDGTIKLWDVATGREVRSIEGHGALVYDVAFDASGEILASASGDRTVRLWDPATGAELATLRGHAEIALCVAFSPDGSLLASGSVDHTVRVWDVRERRQVSVLVGHEDEIRDVAFNPDRTWIVSAGLASTVRLWDPATEEVRTLRGHTAWVYDVAVSPDGRRIASAGGESFPSDDRSVRLWDLHDGRLLAMHDEHGDLVWSVAFAPDGRLISGSSDRTIKVWNPAGRDPPLTLTGHEGSVCDLAVSPAGIVASASFDGTVRLWEGREPTCRHVLNGHGGRRVWCVAFSPDGRRLASGSVDRSVRVWQTSSGEELTVLDEHDSTVRAIAFHPTADVLAAGLENGTIAIWSVGERRRLATLEGHTNFVAGLAFTPDGRRLASASRDYTIKLWETEGWREVATLHGHSSYVHSLAFTPDGRDLISGSADLTIRIWDGG